MHAVSQASWEPLLLFAVSCLREFEGHIRFISLSPRKVHTVPTVPIPYAIYPPALHWAVPGCVRKPSSQFLLCFTGGRVSAKVVKGHKASLVASAPSLGDL